MSGALRDQAFQHLQKAESQLEREHYSDALLTLEKAGQLANEVQAPDIQSIVIENVGRIMQLAGMYDEILSSCTAPMRALLSDMDRRTEAMRRFVGVLSSYTEPMQHTAIRVKLMAIISCIQVFSKSAEGATNKIKKSEYFKKAWTAYNQHREFFTECDLDYEHRLAREAGSIAHIQYLMLNAEAEKDLDKRIREYEKCIRVVGEILEDERDPGLKELWSSIMHYLGGRRQINIAMKSDPPERESIEQAVEQFKLAKDRYEHANVCYLTYNVLLKFESVEVLDDAAVQRILGALQNAINNSTLSH